MTFSYTPSATPTDKDRVRFHTGDTTEGENFLSDEEITMILAETGSWQQAVISGIRYIIAKLSKPNFQADWLTVNHTEARKGYERLLAEKQRELGVAAITATAVSVQRSDSRVDAEDVWLP